MKELKFQQKAVRKLVDETIDLLRLSGQRKTLIFKAPTGAGKTVMASQMLAYKKTKGAPITFKLMLDKYREGMPNPDNDDSVTSVLDN